MRTQYPRRHLLHVVVVVVVVVVIGVVVDVVDVRRHSSIILCVQSCMLMLKFVQVFNIFTNQHQPRF